LEGSGSKEEKFEGSKPFRREVAAKRCKSDAESPERMKRCPLPDGLDKEGHIERFLQWANPSFDLATRDLIHLAADVCAPDDVLLWNCLRTALNEFDQRALIALHEAVILDYVSLYGAPTSNGNAKNDLSKDKSEQ